VKRAVYFAALGGALVSIVGFFWLAPRGTVARVDAGPVGERIVARAIVVPSAGVIHVFAAADGRIVRVRSREGDLVEQGEALAELDVAGRSEALLSPVRGVVLARHVEVGDYALSAAHGAPAPLFELADPAHTELRVEVEEADAALLSAKLPVSIALPGAAAARARCEVTRVSGRLERRSIGADDARVRADGMVRVAVASWLGEHPAWPLGTRVEASIELQRRAAPTRVPRAALSVRDGRAVVQRPVAFWTREAPVEIVRVDDAFAEIRGLPLGTEVVIPRRTQREDGSAQVDRVDSVEAVR
jgi:multidrug efflux pump subunit AcrA (membrane-fusion protein)